MKYVSPLLAAVIVSCTALPADPPRFVDDSSLCARNGDCDDRRFFGLGMAKDLDIDDVGRDASDCRRAFEFGQITLWDMDAARAATQCRAIRFGDNSSQWANDNECDDPRFEGPGTASVMLQSDFASDATDCRRACADGTAVLRSY